MNLWKNPFVNTSKDIPIPCNTALKLNRILFETEGDSKG